jgi:hypothetical protein
MAPACNPATRGMAAVAVGTTRASGLLPSVRMTSVPATTRDSNSVRCSCVSPTSIISEARRRESEYALAEREEAPRTRQSHKALANSERNAPPHLQIPQVYIANCTHTQPAPDSVEFRLRRTHSDCRFEARYPAFKHPLLGSLRARQRESASALGSGSALPPFLGRDISPSRASVWSFAVSGSPWCTTRPSCSPGR